MSGLKGKRWYFFIWDEHNMEHLAQHRISMKEAEEVFFNDYYIVPNKKKHGARKYRIEGGTNGGRYLRLIFEDFGKALFKNIVAKNVCRRYST